MEAARRRAVRDLREIAEEAGLGLVREEYLFMRAFALFFADPGPHAHLLADIAVDIFQVLARSAGLAFKLFLLVEQRLTVVHRDLIIVRMDFAEGQEAVAVTAEIDEGRLQGRFHPRDFRKIDIAFDLFFECGLDIVFVETVAGCDDNPNLFRVRAIHKHAL